MGEESEKKKEWISMGKALNAKPKSLYFRLLRAMENLWKSQPRFGGSLHFKVSLAQGGGWMTGGCGVIRAS